jgi:DNA end-binding protein Ku
MYYADEIRDPATEVPGLPDDLTFSGRELDTAKMLIESMASPWDPAVYEDQYRRRVEGLIDQKRQGKVIVTERPETRPTPVVDLMAALTASVEAARAHRPGARLTEPEPAASRPRRGARGAATGAKSASGSRQDLSALTKTELQERAAQLGIAGRSRMTRDELESAVAGALKAARRRRAS